MKSIHEWFSEYEVSHQNRVNKLLHWVGIPLIVTAALGGLSLIEVPLPAGQQGVSASVLAVVVAIVLYGRLSLALALGLGAVFTGLLLVADRLSLLPVPLPITLGVLFVLGWVAQLVGHRFEGKKPSFSKDLGFLFIGPLWLLGFIYRGLGIRY